MVDNVSFKITADSSGAETALKNISKLATDTDSKINSLRKNIATVGTNTKGISNVSQRLKTLTTKLDSTIIKVKSLSASLNKIGIVKLDLKTSVEDLNALNQAFEKVEKSAAEVSQAMTNMSKNNNTTWAKTASNAVLTLAESIMKSNQAAIAAGSAFNKYHQAMTSIGKTVNQTRAETMELGLVVKNNLVKSFIDLVNSAKYSRKEIESQNNVLNQFIKSVSSAAVAVSKYHQANTGLGKTINTVRSETMGLGLVLQKDLVKGFIDAATAAAKMKAEIMKQNKVLNDFIKLAVKAADAGKRVSQGFVTGATAANVKLGGFIRGLKQSTLAMNELGSRVSVLRQMTNELSAAKQKANEVAEAMRKAKTEIGFFQRTMIRASQHMATLFGMRILSGIYEFIAGLSEAGSALLGYRNALMIVGGTIDIANQRIGNAIKIATELRLSINEVTREYSKFVNAASIAGVSVKKAEKQFRSFAVAARVMNLNGQQVSGMFLALEQMISKGFVSMEELRRQLGQYIPGAMALAAQAWGGAEASISEFYSAVKKGTLESVPFIEKFSSLIEERVGHLLPTALKKSSAAFIDLYNSIDTLQKVISLSIQDELAALALGLSNLVRVIGLVALESSSMEESLKDALKNQLDPQLVENIDKTSTALKKQGDIIDSLGESIMSYFDKADVNKDKIVSLSESINAGIILLIKFAFYLGGAVLAIGLLLRALSGLKIGFGWISKPVGNIVSKVTGMISNFSLAAIQAKLLAAKMWILGSAVGFVTAAIAVMVAGYNLGVWFREWADGTAEARENNEALLESLRRLRAEANQTGAVTSNLIDKLVGVGELDYADDLKAMFDEQTKLNGKMEAAIEIQSRYEEGSEMWDVARAKIADYGVQLYKLKQFMELVNESAEELVNTLTEGAKAAVEAANKMLEYMDSKAFKNITAARQVGMTDTQKRVQDAALEFHKEMHEAVVAAGADSEKLREAKEKLTKAYNEEIKSIFLLGAEEEKEAKRKEMLKQADKDAKKALRDQLKLQKDIAKAVEKAGVARAKMVTARKDEIKKFKQETKEKLKAVNDEIKGLRMTDRALEAYNLEIEKHNILLALELELKKDLNMSEDAREKVIRESAAALDELNAASMRLYDEAKLVEYAKEVKEEWEGIFEELGNGMEDTFVDIMTGVLKKSQDISDAIRDVFRNLVGDLIRFALRNPVQILTMLTGGGMAGPNAMQGATGLLGGGTGLFNNLSGIAQFFGLHALGAGNLPMEVMGPGIMGPPQTFVGPPGPAPYTNPLGTGWGMAGVAGGGLLGYGIGSILGDEKYGGMAGGIGGAAGAYGASMFGLAGTGLPGIGGALAMTGWGALAALIISGLSSALGDDNANSKLTLFSGGEGAAKGMFGASTLQEDGSFTKDKTGARTGIWRDMLLGGAGAKGQHIGNPNDDQITNEAFQEWLDGMNQVFDTMEGLDQMAADTFDLSEESIKKIKDQVEALGKDTEKMKMPSLAEFVQERYTVIFEEIGGMAEALWSNLTQAGLTDDTALQAVEAVILLNAELVGLRNVASTATEMLEGMALTQYDMLNLQREEVYKLVDSYDGTLASTQQLTAGLDAQRQSTLNLLIAIEQIRAGMEAMFASTREKILTDVMTDEEKFNYYKQQADALTDDLATMTDPAKIKQTTEEINRLLGLTWGLQVKAGEEEAQIKQQEYLNYLDKVNKLAQDRLDIAKAEATGEASLLADAVEKAVLEAVAPITEAAEEMSGASENLDDAASSIKQAVTAFGIDVGIFGGFVDAIDASGGLTL